MTPSPVMATLWPDSCKAVTSASFCSGETRAKTVYSLAIFLTSSTSIPSKEMALSASMTPQMEAILETVLAASPEMIFTATPFSLKYLMVPSADLRMPSFKTTRAKHSSFLVKQTTRMPSFCFSWASSLTMPSFKSISGAPKRRTVPSFKVTWLYLRALEKGTTDLVFKSLFGMKRSFKAREVWLSSFIAPKRPEMRLLVSSWLLLS